LLIDEHYRRKKHVDPAKDKAGLFLLLVSKSMSNSSFDFDRKWRLLPKEIVLTSLNPAFSIWLKFEVEIPKNKGQGDSHLMVGKVFT